MAAVLLLGTVTFNTTAGDKTVTATPTVGDLIVIIAASSGLAGGTTACSDNNSDGLGAYTQVDVDRTGFSTTGVLTAWIRNALIGSATSTVFTASQAGSSGGGLAVLRVTGMSRVGANALRQSGGQSSGTAGATPQPTLSVAADTNNPVIIAVANGTNSTTTVQQRTGYTERFDNGYTSPATGLEVCTRDSGETNSLLTLGGTTASAFAAIALELDSSSPPAGGDDVAQYIGGGYYPMLRDRAKGIFLPERWRDKIVVPKRRELVLS